MFIHWALQEIHLKIVYYGPGLSGKTANLQFIYDRIDPKLKGELVSLKTQEDRTIFFDFLQLEVGRINGKKPKFNLYTVPGQIHYELTRKIMLNGVDGIVYVADSQRERMDANLNTLMDLEQNLLIDGKTLEDFPWVIQYNKRDLPNIHTVREMEEKLNFHHVPAFESVVVKGDGVFLTLKEIIKRVVSRSQQQLEQRKRMRA